MCYVPCRILSGGGVLTDCPGSNDAHPFKHLAMQRTVEQCHCVVAVCPKRILSCGGLHHILEQVVIPRIIRSDGVARLVVLHNAEKEDKMMSKEILEDLLGGRPTQPPRFPDFNGDSREDMLELITTTLEIESCQLTEAAIKARAEELLRQSVFFCHSCSNPLRQPSSTSQISAKPPVSGRHRREDARVDFTRCSGVGRVWARPAMRA